MYIKNIKTVSINKHTCKGITANVADNIVTEAPLQIMIAYGHKGERKKEIVSVTMRTPGNDFELVTGFLFNEAIITRTTDIVMMRYTNNEESILLVELSGAVDMNIDIPKRNFITNSACGLCGSIDGTLQRTSFIPIENNFKIAATVLYQLPALLRSAQNIFSQTGGAHAVALVNVNGELLQISEDVGRHNAMDKLVGKMLKLNALPLSDAIVLFSGRLSYELIQKSLMAGISTVCAMGAPTSLAIELAEDHGLTTIGFLKKESFNIYCGAERIIQL